MIPEIFSIGPIPINSFGLMIALSLLGGMHLLAQSFRAYGLPESRAEHYVFVGGFSGLLGARIWSIVENWNEVQRNLGAALLSSAGFTFYGGFVVAFLVLYLLCRRDKIPFGTFLDAAAPTMALGYAIGRLGCQLSGDGDYGMPTDSIFGMSYATGIVPTPPGFLAYPTPLYESAVCMAILPLLLKVERIPGWGLPMRRFGLYLSLIALERFFIEFIRINPRIVFGLSEAQLISVSFFVIGMVLLVTRRNPSASGAAAR